MLRIRRRYFYLVLYLAVSMLLVGAATLLRVALERVLDVAPTQTIGLFLGRGQAQEQTALGVALVLVGLPVWLLHLRVVRRWLDGPSGIVDRTSVMRRLYLYAVLLTMALVDYSNARDLLETVIGLASSQTMRMDAVTGTLPCVMVAAALWGYHCWIARADRQIGGEEGASASLRRW
jgi:hypothetical protein